MTLNHRLRLNNKKKNENNFFRLLPTPRASPIAIGTATLPTMREKKVNPKTKMAVRRKERMIAFQVRARASPDLVRAT